MFSYFSFLGELVAPRATKSPEPEPEEKASDPPVPEYSNLIIENKPKQYNYITYERILATNEEGEEIVIDMPKDSTKSNHPPTSS